MNESRRVGLGSPALCYADMGAVVHKNKVLEYDLYSPGLPGYYLLEVPVVP
jgi:hypothetical protein